jgi:hypothetical protein
LTDCLGDVKRLAYPLTGQAQGQAIGRVEHPSIARCGGKENQRTLANNPGVTFCGPLDDVVDLSGNVNLGLAQYLPPFSGRSVLLFSHKTSLVDSNVRDHNTDARIEQCRPAAALRLE